MSKCLIFLVLVSTLSTIAFGMSQSKCNATLVMQKKPDMCAKAKDSEKLLSTITDPTSKAIIQKAMTNLDAVLRNPANAAMFSNALLNQPLTAQFKQQEPQNYNKLVNLLNQAQQEAQNSGIVVVSSSKVCSYETQFTAIINSLSDAGKQTFGTMICGMHESLKSQMPQIMSQIISKQDMMTIMKNNPQLIQQFGSRHPN